MITNEPFDAADQRLLVGIAGRRKHTRVEHQSPGDLMSAAIVRKIAQLEARIAELEEGPRAENI